MFLVTGTIDSVPYLVGVHPAPVEGELHGCVMGSIHATTLLSRHAGKQVWQTPTDEAIKLSLDDPTSVLVALQMLTNVTRVDGGPQPTGGVVRGVIY